ncbi:PTS system IIB component, Fru family [Caloramator quimbayensis]|uniref:PTS system IIB component, Fru family n=1 Tax=Caloramator quimbayensis TaxID=1147123 RepID=A0A1T4Y7Y1_9CLOT|nr:PTS fructose-like transporter subunit IIB [Caloramator quimbayensis]SKA97944.1 PTS system IIB component, Fru family [Caloramator quimbayensis]
MKLLAVTSCLSGVAHTYLAAEALERAAKKRGIEIKIETQGAMGQGNIITMEDIKNADAIILTKDVDIKEKERFKGKPIFYISTTDAVRRSEQVMKKIEEYFVTSKECK